MHPFPHRYEVSAAATGQGSVTLASSGIPDLASDGPREFDGPGDLWSPETLLCGAVADCYALSFRAVANASRFAWERLDTRVVGTLERVEKVTLFTRFEVHARLVVPAGADAARAQSLLEKSKSVCLISNSLKGEIHLQTEIVTAS